MENHWIKNDVKKYLKKELFEKRHYLPGILDQNKRDIEKLFLANELLLILKELHNQNLKSLSRIRKESKIDEILEQAFLELENKERQESEKRKTEQIEWELYIKQFEKRQQS